MLRLTSEIHKTYEFGPYQLDAAKRLLTKESKRIPLGPKTFDLLLLFIDAQGRVLTRTELLRALWPDIFVEESNLSFQISALRKALGDEGAEWIETVHKYGYRFAVTVTEVANPVVVVPTDSLATAPGQAMGSDEQQHPIEIPGRTRGDASRVARFRPNP